MPHRLHPEAAPDLGGRRAGPGRPIPHGRRAGPDAHDGARRLNAGLLRAPHPALEDAEPGDRNPRHEGHLQARDRRHADLHDRSERGPARSRSAGTEWGTCSTWVLPQASRWRCASTSSWPPPRTSTTATGDCAGVGNMLFGGTGIFIDTFTGGQGGGTVWLHGYGQRVRARPRTGRRPFDVRAVAVGYTRTRPWPWRSRWSACEWACWADRATWSSTASPAPAGSASRPCTSTCRPRTRPRHCRYREFATAARGVSRPAVLFGDGL